MHSLRLLFRGLFENTNRGAIPDISRECHLNVFNGVVVFDSEELEVCR